MIKCIQCGGDVEADGNIGIVMNVDGDFVCNTDCKRKYEMARDHFFDVVLSDEKKFLAWLGASE